MGGIRRFGGRCFNSGHDIRFDASHDVGLDPGLFGSLFTPLVVEPSSVVGGGEAGAINQAVPQRRLNVRCESTSREARVDFVGGRKQHVRDGQTRTAFGLRWLRDSGAEVSEKDKEPLLLIPLREVIARLVLRIGGRGSRINGNHGGATTSAMVRGRWCQQHWRPHLTTIIEDFVEEVKLKRDFSQPITSGMCRDAYTSAAVPNHYVAYSCSVADSVTGCNRGRGPGQIRTGNAPF